MFRISDEQIGGRYFWEGHIFKDNSEAVDGLASFHDIDFSECLEDGDERDIYEYLAEEYSNDKDRLDFLLEHGQWSKEKVKSDIHKTSKRKLKDKKSDVSNEMKRYTITAEVIATDDDEALQKFGAGEWERYEITGCIELPKY